MNPDLDRGRLEEEHEAYRTYEDDPIIRATRRDGLALREHSLMIFDAYERAEAAGTPGPYLNFERRAAASTPRHRADRRTSAERLADSARALRNFGVATSDFVAGMGAQRFTPVIPRRPSAFRRLLSAPLAVVVTGSTVAILLAVAGVLLGRWM